MGHDRLPLASGEQHAKAFEAVRVDPGPATRIAHHPHQTGLPATLSVPDHREVKRALLAKLIKAAGMTEDEYLAQFARR